MRSYSSPLTQASKIFLALLLLFTLPSALTAQTPASCGFDDKLKTQLSNDTEFAKALDRRNQQWESVKHLYQGDNLNTGINTIPVVVHVYHLGEAVGTGTNISATQIQSAIDNLNDALGATGPYTNSASTSLRFALAQYDTDCNAFSGIIRTNMSGYSAGGDNYAIVGMTDNNEAALKGVSIYPSSSYYNIWVVSEIDGNNGGSGTQGYAYFPGSPANVDGTVILYNSFGYDPGTGNSSGFNLKNYTDENETTIHEIGHAFDLYHTFEGDGGGGSCPASGNNCGNGVGDCCADTPIHKRSSGCPTGTNDCTNTPLGDLPKNFMDYSNEDCQELFTADQAARIEAALQNGRASLVNSIGLTGLPASYSAPNAANCTTTTSSTGLGGGFGGLMSVQIGTNTHETSLTVNDQTTYGGNGYLDFTDDCSRVFVLDENTTYSSIPISTWFNDHNVYAWIDYNNNNSFEASEMIFSTTTGNRDANNITSGVASFTVAASAITDTYLRMRFLCDLDPLADACSDPVYGQCEDVGVYIKSATSCSTNLVITDNPSSGLYQVSNTITTSGTVTVSGTATYDAGTSITLNPGFHATVTFSAIIGGCVPLRQSEDPVNAFVDQGMVQDALEETLSKDIKLSELGLTIHPNPLTNQATFTINLLEPTALDLQVFNANGQLMDQVAQGQQLTKGLHTIGYDASQLKGGMFHVILKTGKQLITKKMIVVK